MIVNIDLLGLAGAEYGIMDIFGRGNAILTC